MHLCRIIRNYFFFLWLMINILKLLQLAFLELSLSFAVCVEKAKLSLPYCQNQCFCLFNKIKHVNQRSRILSKGSNNFSRLDTYSNSQFKSKHIHVSYLFTLLLIVTHLCILWCNVCRVEVLSVYFCVLPQVRKHFHLL